MDPDSTAKKVKKLRLSFLTVEGFCCGLDVLYGGMGITKLHFFIKKNTKKYSAVNFFPFLVVKTLDQNPDSHPTESALT